MKKKKGTSWNSLLKCSTQIHDANLYPKNKNKKNKEFLQ